jgi:glutathione S-transferase
VQKVLFLLEELKVPYVREDYGRQFGNTETDAYRALNPTAKVPTLVDGEAVIWESNTILRYLAGKHDPSLLGGSLVERTEVERWMDWLLATVNANYVAVFKDSKKEPAERAPAFADSAKELAAALVLADGHLASRDFFALGRFTLADAALGPILSRCLGFPIERPGLADLERWMAAIEARPAFEVAVGKRRSSIAATAA